MLEVPDVARKGVVTILGVAHCECPTLVAGDTVRTLQLLCDVPAEVARDTTVLLVVVGGALLVVSRAFCMVFEDTCDGIGVHVTTVVCDVL